MSKLKGRTGKLDAFECWLDMFRVLADPEIESFELVLHFWHRANRAWQREPK